MAQTTWKHLVWLPGMAVTAWFVGGCGSKDSTGTPSPDYSVTADTAAPTTLGTSVTIHVHLTSSGASGPVTLSVTGAPASWTVTPPGAPVNLTANGSANANVQVTVPTTGAAAAGGQTLTITASGAGHDHTAKTLVTVANQLILPIQLGALASTHWGSLGSDTIHINVGTVVSFRNDDTTGHLIHSNGSIPGIAHQSVVSPLAPGDSYSQTPTATGTDRITCHLHLADTLKLRVQ